MNKYVVFLLLVLGSILLIGQLVDARSSPKGGRQQAADVTDDDEFSEFDDEFESVPKSKKAASTAAGGSAAESSKKTQQKHQTNDDDFEEVAVEDEDVAENEFASSRPSPSSKSQIKDDTRKKAAAAEEKEAQNKKKPTEFSNLNADDLDMEEFEHFADEDEFETEEEIKMPSKDASGSEKQKSNGGSKQDAKGMPSLKIADVPMHLMTNGNNFRHILSIKNHTYR